jgi:hypothetical protein
MAAGTGLDCIGERPQPLESFNGEAAPELRAGKVYAPYLRHRQRPSIPILTNALDLDALVRNQSTQIVPRGDRVGGRAASARLAAAHLRGVNRE